MSLRRRSLASTAMASSGSGPGRPPLSTPPRHGAPAVPSTNPRSVGSTGKSVPPRHSAVRAPPKTMRGVEQSSATAASSSSSSEKGAEKGLRLSALVHVELAGFAVWALFLGSAIERACATKSILAAFGSTLVHIALAIVRHSLVCTVRDDFLARTPFVLRSLVGMVHLHAAHAAAFALLSDSLVTGAMTGAAYSISYILSSRYIIPFSISHDISTSSKKKRGRIRRIFMALATPKSAMRAAALAIAPVVASRAFALASDIELLPTIARAACIIVTAMAIEATYVAFIAEGGSVGKVLPRSMMACARGAESEDGAAIDALLASLELCDGASIEEAFLALPLEPHAKSPKKRSGLLEFAQAHNNLPGNASDRADAVRHWWQRAIGRVSSTSSARLRDVMLLASNMRFREVNQAVYTADAAEPGRAFVARTKLPASLEIVRARAFMELASIAASSSSDAKLARQELFSGVDQWGGMRFMRLASTCTSVIDALSLALEAYVEMRAEKPTTLPEASKILLGPRPAEARNMTDAEIASVTWTAMRRAREAKSKPWVGPEWWRSIIRGPFEPIDPVAEQRHDESAASSSGKTPWTPLSVARRPVQRQAQALLADAAAVAHAARAMACMIQASAKGEDTHRVAADAIPAILQSLLRLHIALDTVDAKLTSKIWAVPYPSLKHTRGKAPKRGRKLKRIALPPSGLSLLDSVDKAIVQVCNCVVTDADGIDVIKFSDPALDDCYASFQAARG